MTKTFRDALLEALISTGISLKALSDATDVSYEQLKKLKQRSGSTNIDDAVRIAAFFGKTVEDFINDPELSGPLRVVDLYFRLPPEKRPRLEAFGEGMLDYPPVPSEDP